MILEGSERFALPAKMEGGEEKNSVLHNRERFYDQINSILSPLHLGNNTVSSAAVDPPLADTGCLPCPMVSEFR